MPAGHSRARTPATATAGAAGICARDLPLFRRRLLAWFRGSQRDLPWRRTRDPYRIWISEIMLQQTRVAAVIPYYERFLTHFPTVRHLARAREQAVLSAWAGLGYYSRARNLHKAARRIVARHGGKFPRELRDALALPGIGPYSAAAILSIAYGEPLAVLDGNVARVLARLGARRGDLRAPETWRHLSATAGDLLAHKASGDWNQAMMELGATVCAPVSPRCTQCPVARWCRARELGLAQHLPETRRKSATVKITIAAAVLLDPRGRTLLVREPAAPGLPAVAGQLAAASNGGLFSRLWQFPAVQSQGRAAETLSSHLARLADSRSTSRAAALGAAMKPLPAARHTVTFREIQLLPFLIPVRQLPSIAGARTPRLTALDRLPISSATRKIAAAALRAV